MVGIEGGAEVLQEQIHHEEDQQDRLQQGFTTSVMEAFTKEVVS